ncbi:MAG: DOMON-like domain-containing protein [Allosphingosinicella sp.]
MLLELTPHPETPCAFIDRLEVEVARHGTSLTLDYRLRGDTSRLRLPDRSEPRRRDGLWQHSCFEAFVHGAGESYGEINLSPSTEWAAYVFDAYRAGMRALDQVPDPGIGVRGNEMTYELRAKMELGGVAALRPDRPWRIGLSAVIEDVEGAKSYWALAHPPGPPDFHHRDCFALELPPAA